MTYDMYRDNRVTMDTKILIVAFEDKLNTANHWRPDPVLWQAIWESEARYGSEADDNAFRESYCHLFDSGILQE